MGPATIHLFLVAMTQGEETQRSETQKLVAVRSCHWCRKALDVNLSTSCPFTVLDLGNRSLEFYIVNCLCLMRRTT